MAKKATKKISLQPFTTDRPVIIITGAGKGIGRAIVAELCERVLFDAGNFLPHLVLISRTAKDLDEVKKECQAAGVDAYGLCGDISNLNFIHKVINDTIKLFGKIDCLINNAGVGRFGDFLDLSEKDFEYVMGTNLKGTFFLTQKVFEVMQARKRGHIIFVTSVAAEKPFEQSAIYCMSKFAQKGFLEVLRLYGYKNNIRVTNVMPGAVETPMWGNIPDKMKQRMMKAEDIAKSIVDAFFQPTRTSVEEIVLRPITGDL